MLVYHVLQEHHQKGKELLELWGHYLAAQLLQHLGKSATDALPIPTIPSSLA